MPMITKEYNLSVPQVAEILNVHRNTVLYWIRMGFVKATVKKRPDLSPAVYDLLPRITTY